MFEVSRNGATFRPRLEIRPMDGWDYTLLTLMLRLSGLGWFGLISKEEYGLVGYPFEMPPAKAQHTYLRSLRDLGCKPNE